MALVAYAASDDSDAITDDEDDAPSGGVEILEKSKENPKLFTTLPQPKAATKFADIAEENDEFLLKKEQPTEKPVKKPVRIVAPSLIDLDSDDEEPQEKKPKFVSKASGLFSILPPPKIATITTKSLVPHSVAKKAKSVPTNMVPRTVKTIKTKPVAAVKATQSTESDDEDDDIKVEEFDLNAWKAVCGRKSKPEPIVQVIDYSEQANAQEIDTAPEPEKPYEGLDNEAFKKLLGSSKIRPQNIRFIDINEEEIMTEEDILRAKALTDPAVELAAKEEEPINAISKRKHHITYLAQQAKANEQELKNRWATSRYSRKQTQAKYGF